MQTIKPKRLQKGDTVAIVSPSEPITKDLREQFDGGVKALESFGLKVKLGNHVFDQYYYNAGTRENRIKDFNNMWKDPEVKMILMSQGGETANHLLDGIDYEMIRKNPKIFAGISDGTTLLNAIFVKTGLVTYHGPDLVWTFGRKMTEPFQENFIKTLFEGNVRQLVPNPNWIHQEKPELKYKGWRNLRSGKVSGVLVGGHTGCLMTTILAGYGPSFDKAFYFWKERTMLLILIANLLRLDLTGYLKKSMD